MDTETLARIKEAIAEFWNVTVIYTNREEIVIQGVPRDGLAFDFALVHSRLEQLGYQVEIQTFPDQPLIRLHPTIPSGRNQPSEIADASTALPRKRKMPWLNIGLFFASLISMTVMKPFLENGFSIFSNPRPIIDWLPFSGALISILLFHEFGHYFMSRARGVKTTLPYFIPAPTLFGTFGAFIKSQSIFHNRKDLLAIGAAGPIAGFVVAVPILFWGLTQARLIPATSGGLNFGDSILIRLLTWVVFGKLPEEMAISAGPLVLAGWTGIFVTMINLLPLGQLDGGHITYGILGYKQATLARWVFILLVPLGFFWSGWWFWAAIVFVLGLKHPPTFNDQESLDLSHKILVVLSAIIFILCFIPIPFSE